MAAPVSQHMDNLTTPVTVVVGGGPSGTVSHVQPIVAMSGVPNVSDGNLNLANIAMVPSASQVVGGSMPTISQVWYTGNCGIDGITQLVSANPQTINEVNSADISRQFSQQVQTPYGNIQVQVQSVPITTKQEVVVAPEPPKPAPKSRVRQSGNERVPCPTCGKTVSCNATLRDHMRTHTGDRPFVCTECGFAFAQRSNLRMHKRLHTGERPYMCGICGKTFARSSHLPAHMRTHTGEKPYVCEACEHAFITAQQLKNHFRVHTGEKPWKCDICPAAFTHSSSLSTHKKKHTGMKPYQCEKCQKCFFFTSALDKHMKVHSKARPFSCTECDKSFKYKESLTVHRERYCGKELAKRSRAPRRADARKPGPKAGTGRKYVQKKRGRIRGRPRKRGRWSARVKTKRNYQDMVGIDSEEVIEEEIMNPKEEDDDEEFDEEKLEECSNYDEEMDSNADIPTAELKVEVINPDDMAEAMGISEHVTRFRPEIIEENPSQITGDIIQIQSSNEIHIDETTSLTIVSAEEAEKQMSAGGIQLVSLNTGMPIQFVQNETDVHIKHQIISRDNIQMWYPKQ